MAERFLCLRIKLCSTSVGRPLLGNLSLRCLPRKLWFTKLYYIFCFRRSERTSQRKTEIEYKNVYIPTLIIIKFFVSRKLQRKQRGTAELKINRKGRLNAARLTLSEKSCQFELTFPVQGPKLQYASVARNTADPFHRHCCKGV